MPKKRMTTNILRAEHEPQSRPRLHLYDAVFDIQYNNFLGRPSFFLSIFDFLSVSDGFLSVFDFYPFQLIPFMLRTYDQEEDLMFGRVRSLATSSFIGVSCLSCSICRS